MSDNPIIGRIGTLTRLGAIRPGRSGEVMITLGGAAEAFVAYAEDQGSSIATGERVVVMDQRGPRTVIVAPFDTEHLTTS